MPEILNRTFSAEKTQKNFSSVVKLYDVWARLTESKAIKTALEKVNSIDNGKILDIGVGTGDMFYKILPFNKTGLNVGLDISPQMIRKTREKSKGIKIGNINFILGNAFYLPFRHSSFDYVFSSYVFDLFPESQFNNITKEIDRILKTEGKAVIITMSFGNRWYNQFWFLLAKYFPSLLTNCRPVDLQPYFENVFKNIETINISQNSFPSKIISAVKST